MYINFCLTYSYVLLRVLLLNLRSLQPPPSSVKNMIFWGGLFISSSPPFSSLFSSPWLFYFPLSLFSLLPSPPKNPARSLRSAIKSLSGVAEIEFRAHCILAVVAPHLLSPFFHNQQAPLFWKALIIHFTNFKMHHHVFGIMLPTRFVSLVLTADGSSSKGVLLCCRHLYTTVLHRLSSTKVHGSSSLSSNEQMYKV